MKDGFVKAAAAAPVIRVADAEYNADRVIECMKKAEAQGVKVLVFPELTLTGCTCFDLFRHKVLLDGAEKALVRVIAASAGMDMLVFVGLPFAVGSKVFSCAAVIHAGELIGLVPRENVAGSHFSSPEGVECDVTVGDAYTAFLSADILFESNVLDGLSVAVELGGDSEALVPPAVRHAAAGATIIANMASFPATVSSTADAELAIRHSSSHLSCAMITAAPGKGESTTDNVYSGLCMIAENGKILAECEQAGSFAVSEIDVEYLTGLRRGRDGFDTAEYPHCISPWGSRFEETVLTREYSRLPHLPDRAEDVPAYCERMLDIQISGLVKRMEYAHLDH